MSEADAYNQVIVLADKTQFQRRIQDAASGLKGGGGGGTLGGMPPDLPERVGKLETHIDHINRNIDTIQKDVRDIRTDMRTDAKEFRSLLLRSFLITWGGLIVVALGLAGLMAKGFKWI